MKIIRVLSVVCLLFLAGCQLRLAQYFYNYTGAPVTVFGIGQTWTVENGVMSVIPMDEKPGNKGVLGLNVKIGNTKRFYALRRGSGGIINFSGYLEKSGMSSVKVSYGLGKDHRLYILRPSDKSFGANAISQPSEFPLNPE